MTEFRRPAEIDIVAANRGAVSVVVPPEHQGVVNALRSAFSPCRSGLPVEMSKLLDRLG